MYPVGLLAPLLLSWASFSLAVQLASKKRWGTSTHMTCYLNGTTPRTTVFRVEDCSDQHSWTKPTNATINVRRLRKGFQLKFSKKVNRLKLVFSSKKRQSYCFEIASATFVQSIEDIRELTCIFHHKHHDIIPHILVVNVEDSFPRPQATTTSTPSLCYNWRPKALTLHPGENNTVTVKWEPAFVRSGFIVSLSKQDKPHDLLEQNFPSYKSIYQITNFTFTNVKPGRYRAQIQATGCRDCPEFEYKGCYIVSTASKEIIIDKEDITTTTSTPSLCYNWRPKALTLHPGENNTVTVKWEPAFVRSGFIVSLSKQDKPHDLLEQIFPSYNSVPITQCTFHNVTTGQYVAMIKPTGCRDCPRFKYEGCNISPSMSEQINIEKQNTIIVPPTASHFWGISRQKLAPDDKSILIMVGVPVGLVLVSVIVVSSVCIIKDQRRKKTSRPLNDTKITSSLDVIRCRPRIVILYGVDNAFHVSAVWSLARILRQLLDVDVVLDRDQSKSDTRDASTWITNTFPTDTRNTTVIVVVSEALYRLSCPQTDTVSDTSRVKGDMFAYHGPMALRYLRQIGFPSKQIVPVSFGYEDDSLQKMRDSFSPLFQTECSELTTKENGVRTYSFSVLWRCLSMKEPCVELERLEEVHVFLANVDLMSEHVRQYGSTYWEQDQDTTSYLSYGNMINNGRRTDIDTDTFTVVTESTASSHVTIDLLCKKCRASDCVTLQSCATGYARSLSVRQYETSAASCLTLYVPDTPQCGIGYQDCSETTRMLPANDTMVSVESDSTIQYDSVYQSAEITQIEGREC